MAQFATLSSSQLATIKLARVHADKATRQQIKKDVFTCAKARFGLPDDMNLKVGMESGLIRTKGGDTFPLADDGKWTGMARPVQVLKWVRLNKSILLSNLRADVRDGTYDMDYEVAAGHDATPSLDALVVDVDNVLFCMDADDLDTDD